MSCDGRTLLSANGSNSPDGTLKPFPVSRMVPSAIGSQCLSWQHCSSYQLWADTDCPQTKAAAIMAPNPDAPPRSLHSQVMINISCA